MNASATSIDLRALIGNDTPLQYVSGTKGGEYAGPCPFCGGRDRLHVQPATGLWRCRQCAETDHWNDAAAYVMQRDGLSYPEALAKLDGLPPAPPPPPPAPLNVPSMYGVAAYCHSTLRKRAKPLAWLDARGIDRDTVDRHNLGYVAPGIPLCMDGHTVAPGIVIPLYGLDMMLYGLKVRRAVGDPKYTQVKGSQMPLYGAINRKRVLVVVEGEFDAMLLAKHAGSLVDVATLGSASASLKDKWCSYLAPYRHILVCYDTDAAGQQSRTWTAIPKARRIAVPVGKDITEAWREGVDLLAWIGLQLAALESMADTPAVLHPVETTHRDETPQADMPESGATAWPTVFGPIDWDVEFPPVATDSPAQAWARSGMGSGLDFLEVRR